MTDQEAISEFLKLPGIAWTMQEANGWWAYWADECPIGPFATEAEAARVGLQVWGKKAAT
jgi:hypothetical protein